MQYIGKKGIEKKVARFPIEDNLLKNELEKSYDRNIKFR